MYYTTFHSKKQSKYSKDTAAKYIVSTILAIKFNYLVSYKLIVIDSISNLHNLGVYRSLVVLNFLNLSLDNRTNITYYF